MIGLELSPGFTQGRVAPALPLADFFRHGGGQHVAIAPGPADTLSIWTEVGPDHAACLRLDNDDTTSRYSWRETLIAQMRSVYPVGEMSVSAGWSQLQSSGSGLAGSYTGNRAISTGSASATASVTVGRADPYDIWIHYTGRTSGGYIRVDIDGSDALVNEIDDPASLGFKAFSSYAATDLSRRQSVKVASGLTGDHDVTVRFGGAASPGGSAIMLEAIAISGNLSDPRVLPPLWQPNTTYAMGDEVQWGGIYYAARGNAQSGTAGPTHSTGIASDGALDWRADNRPTYPEFVAIDYASEREYAVRFDVGGGVTELGGQTHGNELLTNRTILLDGAAWTASTTGTGLSAGTAISIQENLTWQTQTAVPLGDCTLTRMITPGAVRHDVTMLATGPQADIEWMYAGMLPMVRWDGEMRTTVIDRVQAPGQPDVVLETHAGVNPANIGFPDSSRLGLSGGVLGQTLTYGHEAAAVAATGNVLGQVSAFLRPNLDARTSSGGLDWGAKAYVQAEVGAGLSFGAGDTIRFFNRHVIAVTE